MIHGRLALDPATVASSAEEGLRHLDFIVKWFGMSASHMTKQQYAYNAEEGLKQLDFIQVARDDDARLGGSDSSKAP